MSGDFFIVCTRPKKNLAKKFPPKSIFLSRDLQAGSRFLPSPKCCRATDNPSKRATCSRISVQNFAVRISTSFSFCANGNVSFFGDRIDTAQAMTLNENKVAGLEQMRQRYHQNRDMRIRQADLNRARQQESSGGDAPGTVLVGAAVLGGAFLLKKVFGSDDKEQTQPQQTQPNK